MTEIKIKKSAYHLNDEIAAKNHAELRKHGIFALNVMGAPGSGKTTLLENILPELLSAYKTAVIEGDLATENDAERIRKTGVPAYQINTNGGCHLDAKMVEKELKKIDLDQTELIVIENVGNLVCPINFNLGEDLRIVVLSTPEGEDKPLKYPPAMMKTDAVVISKTDIAPYMDIDPEVIKKNILQINPKVCILEAGKINGVYQKDAVVAFLKDSIEKHQAR